MKKKRITKANCLMIEEEEDFGDEIEGGILRRVRKVVERSGRMETH